MKKNKICVKLNKLKENKFITSSNTEYIGYIGLIKINLDNGQSEYIKIYTNSNSDELAYDFCLKHKIDFSVVNQLIKRINDIKENKITTTSNKKSEISFNIRNSIKNTDNKEYREINGLNNYLYNENNLTPINYINNESINNLYDTEEKNIPNIPNMFYNGNNINIQLEDKNTDKKENSENSKNNNDISYELNDSLNDKLNNLEKAYQNFNPENKAKNEKKEGNTKEVIDSIIQECMDILEKEERNNNFNISSPDYCKNCFVYDKENKSAPFLNNNYLFSTPKIKPNEIFSESNLNKVEINKFNSSNENKEYTKNKCIKDNIILSTKTKGGDMLSITNKKYEIKNKNYNNKSINHYNKDSYFNTINHYDINNNKISTFNQTDIVHNIDFSLITKKRNYLFLCSNKDANNNSKNNKTKNYRTIPISKNASRKIRLINKKYFNLQKNSNSSFISQNVNKNKNKRYITYNDNKNSFRTITNYSSLKTIPNTENENQVFSTINTLSNHELLSSNISDKSTYYQNRATLVSNLNYSNMISRGSSNLRLYKKIEPFNSSKISKINQQKNSNFSNDLLFVNKKQKIPKQNYIDNKSVINHENSINLKNINRKLKQVKKKKIIIVNNSFKTDKSIKKNNNKLLMPKTTKHQTKFHSIFGELIKNKNKIICKNGITSNLIEKNEIITSFKNIFNIITKNNRILDAFIVINKNNIPSPIYEIVKNVVKNCDNKKRFIQYDDFINTAFVLFDKFSNEDKISILNYNRYF